MDRRIIKQQTSHYYIVEQEMQSKPLIYHFVIQSKERGKVVLSQRKVVISGTKYHD